VLRLIRTSRRMAVLIISLCVVAVAAVGTAAYGWYYKHYAWPRKIQVEVLGEAIVDHKSFRSVEGSAHWGQGMFRWQYDAPTAVDSAWTKYCGAQPIQHCEFVVPGRPEAEVETSVSYKNGVITIEEWWM
jgi:hypothetical protein